MITIAWSGPGLAERARRQMHAATCSVHARSCGVHSAERDRFGSCWVSHGTETSPHVARSLLSDWETVDLGQGRKGRREEGKKGSSGEIGSRRQRRKRGRKVWGKEGG
eukprot:2024754-Rhodomonas_salina.4